jgi:hypothetical protein
MILPERLCRESRARVYGYGPAAKEPERGSSNRVGIVAPVKRSYCLAGFILIVLVLMTVQPVAGLSLSGSLPLTSISSLTQPGIMAGESLRAVSDPNNSVQVTALPVKAEVYATAEPDPARGGQVQSIAQFTGDSAGVLLIIIPLCMVGLFCLATWGILLIRSWLIRRPDTAQPAESD